MTNINCSADCIYQKDGKCKLESVTAMTITPYNTCVYYSKKPAAKQAGGKNSL